jgi:hypothetical protein
VISAISGAEGELFSDFAGESDCDAERERLSHGSANAGAGVK